MCEILQKIRIFTEQAERFFSPRRILLLAFGFALLWLVLWECFNVEIYRDMANCYAWYAREFGRGYWDGFSIARLPPLNIFLGGLFVKCGIEAYQGLMLLGGMFFILTIFSLYGILKNFLPEKAAAWGCFFFVMTPKIIRFSCMGLLEATRDFFLISAVYLLFCAWRNRAKFYHFILFGGSLGFLSLSRGEGCVMAGLLFLALFVRHRETYRSFGRKILLPAVIAAFAALAVVSPRLIETWKLVGYPVTDARCIGLIKSLPWNDRLFQDKRPQQKVQIDPAWDKLEAHWDTTTGGKLRKYAELPEQMLRGGYELYMIFGAIGILSLIFRRSWKEEYSFLLIFSILSSVIIGWHSMAYRYFVFLVPLWMVFTLHGMIFILNCVQKYQLRGVCLLALGGMALGQTQNAWGQLLKQRDGKREIQMANFLKQNRKLFLPAEEQERKLIIFDDGLPEIVFRADEGRIREHLRHSSSPTLLHGFDLYIIAQKEKERCCLMRARKDLKEIAHPLQSEYLLLAVIREEKKQ